MLTEREVIIYKLVESTGADYRTIADWLDLSHENVRKTYARAKQKLEKFGEMGMFSTTIK